MISFQCECGKAHRAADEHAGKRGRCSACGEVMVVPGRPAADSGATPARTQKSAAPESRPSPRAKPSSLVAAQDASHPYELDDQAPPQPAPLGRPCPNCTRPLPSRDATFCVKCGYNLKTGAKAKVEVTKPKKPRKQKPSAVGQFLADRLTSGKFLGGMASLVGGTVWLGLGLLANRIFFYPIFLIVAGILGVISGLIGGDD